MLKLGHARNCTSYFGVETFNPTLDQFYHICFMLGIILVGIGALRMMKPTATIEISTFAWLVAWSLFLQKIDHVLPLMFCPKLTSEGFVAVRCPWAHAS